MKRIVTIAIAALFLSACGGGGASHSPLPVTGSPVGASQSRTISVSIKVPTKSQQIHRRAFVSPSTQGIGFLASASALTYNANNPPLTQTAALSLTGCPPTNCVTNSDGSQTYTVSVTIPAGTLELIVSLWDQAPISATSFPTGANVLSDDVLGSAQYGGSPTQTLTVTLYGVPASVAIQPYGGQPHVLPDANGYALVGSGCDYFTATPLDADGNPIVGDATAPALATTTVTSAYQVCDSLAGFVGVQAKVAATGSLQVGFTVTAASGVTNTVSGSVNLQAIQELWIPAWGGGPAGLLGFALDPANGYKPSIAPIDFIPIASANPQQNTIDIFGNQWYFDNSSRSLNGFYSAQGAQPPAQILSTPISANGVALNALSADGGGNLWLAETSSGTYQNGAIAVIPLFFQGGFPATINPGSATVYTTVNTSGPVASMGAVPPGATVSSSYGGAVFVAAYDGLYACVISGGLLCHQLNTNQIQTVAVDGQGHLWTYNENGDTLLHAYNITGTFPNPAISAIASTTISPNAGGSTMAATAQGSVWIVNVDGTPTLGVNEFVLNGSTITAGASIPGATLFGDGVYGISVAP